MNDEFGRYYELLGVTPGTAGRELRQAYLDLAKVWHPDRFSHDPRLQQKAQEKLKEINEAYERLSSGKPARAARPSHAAGDAYAPPDAPARGGRAKVILTAAFCAVLVGAVYALTQSGEPQPYPQTLTEQVNTRAVKEREQPDAGNAPRANHSARSNERVGRRPAAEVPEGGKPVAEQGAPQLRPMPTNTVNIDAGTGMLATKDCPVVSRMTYPAGGEPRQHCNAPHNPKGSRVKSAAKRLASPDKWFGGVKVSPNDEASGVRPPGGERRQDR